jgi:chromatin remodeling complex protein RSC6
VFGVAFCVYQQEGELWPPPRKQPRSPPRKSPQRNPPQRNRRKEIRREKGSPKKPAAKKAAKKSASKRKPNAAFMKAMTPSAVLANVIGSSPMPRTEVTKKIWDYIKKNKLQDSINRRLINADEKLRAVFGGKGKVSMFEMTKLVSNHLK